MLSIEQELDRGDSYIQEGNRKISKEQAKKLLTDSTLKLCKELLY